MKKFIYGFAVGAIVMIIVAFVKTNQLRKEANEKIEITQVLYYTHGFKDAQKDVIKAVKAGKRILNASEISPEKTKAGKWITIDSITPDTTITVDENRYKYYRIVLTPLNNKNEIAINTIWYNSIQLSPERMQSILDNAIIMTNPYYIKPEIGDSK